MADRNAAKRFFKKYLLAVIAVAAVIAGIAIAVTVYAMRSAESENTVEESPRFSRTYSADERLLKICAELENGKLSDLTQGIPVLVNGYDPYFELEGVGEISVTYSYDAVSLELLPIEDTAQTESAAQSETEPQAEAQSAEMPKKYGVRIPADVTGLMVEYGTDKAAMFENVSGDMRSYCAFDKQTVGKTYSRANSTDPEYVRPPDRLYDAYRYVFTSYLFIDLVSGDTKLAGAAVKITSKSRWTLGKYTIEPSELIKAEVTSYTDAYHGTSVELVSYWQVEE